jgi:hypothetical protein
MFKDSITICTVEQVTYGPQIIDCNTIENLAALKKCMELCHLELALKL